MKYYKKWPLKVIDSQLIHWTNWAGEYKGLGYYYLTPKITPEAAYNPPWFYWFIE